MISSSILTHAEREHISLLLFPDFESFPSLNELENRFPPRSLSPNAKVTRVAPSPTGFAHIGLVYTSLINRLIAKQSGGVFILRVEDTDTAREVKGATQTVIQTLTTYDLDANEGICESDGNIQSIGSYGPYLQSQRKIIYRAIARELVLRGLAYPCFCTEEDLLSKSERQRQEKTRPGYYGHWAEWRDRSLNEILAALESNPNPVIRLRSVGDHDSRVVIQDGVKGSLSLPQNDLDTVIIKSDGQSLYHLAHLVDDHFMRVTDVVRGDEWVSSTPIHVQIFELLGWTAPRYAHLATIQTLEIEKIINKETGELVERQIKRKLSKRKDPDANAQYYIQEGFPPLAVIEYLLNIANSGFEAWKKQNPSMLYDQFEFNLDNCNTAGALADIVKLRNISRDVISRLSSSEALAQCLAWTKKYDEEIWSFFSKDMNFSLRCLEIENGQGKKSKRLCTWKDIRTEFAWCFRELFEKLPAVTLPINLTSEIQRAVIDRYLADFSLKDSKDEWFVKCKNIASAFNFAADMKAYKAEPSKYIGHIGDITMIFRVALCGSMQSPDLFDVIQLLGEDEMRRRLLAMFT